MGRFFSCSVPLGGNRVAMGQELPALHDLAAMVAIDLVARSDGGSDGDEEACMGEEICMGAARADYDALVEATAREALASDPAAVVVLHTVGGSKTGLRLPSPELSEKLRAEFGEQVDARMGALNAAAKAGAVEVFALCRPSKSTVPAPHQGTYLYYDEMGSLKGLAVNPRAMSIARECGLDVESPFYGDCYIGRVTIEPAPLTQGSFGCVRPHASAVWVFWGVLCACLIQSMHNLTRPRARACVCVTAVASRISRQAASG